MILPRIFIAMLFTTLLASTVLTGCQDKGSSQIQQNSQTNQPKLSPEDQAVAIGNTLEIPNAKPAIGTNGQVLFHVNAAPLLYSDAGLLIALRGETTLIGDAQLGKTLWRQTAGPAAQILNPTLPQAQVILPQVKEITDLEFTFAASDSENRVAEARTRVRVSPLEYSGVAIKTTTVVSADKAVITLTLPEVPQSPVTLYYRTQDGTAVAGQDYEAMENQQVTFNENNSNTIEIKILNLGIATEDRYFRVFYSTESGNPANDFYVVLRHHSSSAPGQPTDPVQPEPNDPNDPNEPTEPTDPTPLPAYNITYSAAEGGRIHGTTQQTLSAGANGSPVTAIANPGYRFVTWSDGLSTATRTATDVKADLQVTAQFRRNELWLEASHYGDINIIAGPTTAVIDWPTDPGKTYDLIVTGDPETAIQNYSVYGAEMIMNVTPPLDIKELTTDQPVYIALQEDGALKSWSSFVPRVLGTDGSVQTIAIDSDGTRYIGGIFTFVSPFTGGGAELTLNHDYSTGVMAGPVIDGEVNAVAPDGYGGWYVGGKFFNILNNEGSYLVHIDAAGRLTDWKHKVFGNVYSIIVDEDIIYVGGSFQITSHIIGGNRRNLAAFDRQGNLLPWNPNSYRTVYAIAVSEDIIYTGGPATYIGDQTTHLEAFDKLGQPVLWNPHITGSTPSIYSLAIKDKAIFAAGNFTHANDEPRKYLAAFDTEGNLLPWNPNPNSIVNSLSVHQNTIYLGGSFTQIGEESRAKLAAVNTDGQLLPWHPEIGTSGAVHAVAPHQGAIFVGGYFSRANGERRNNLAAFDDRGNLLPWNPSTNGLVNTISAGDGSIYVGGKFSLLSKDDRTSLAAFDSNGRLLPWAPDITYPATNALPTVNSILIDKEIVYLGGAFLQAAGEAQQHLAAFDKTGSLLPWTPKLSGTAIVKSLAKTEDIIYVGGHLLWADNRASYGLEAFDVQGNLQTWAPVIDDEVRSLALHQGILYENKRIFQHGVLIGALEGPENLYINALTVEGDLIYAGGQVVPIGGGVGSAALTAFDLQGRQLPWSPQIRGSAMFTSSQVHTVAANSNEIYVGGSFTSANGEPRGHIASFDAEGGLLPWSTLMNNPVYVLVVHEGVVYAGGAFTKAGDQTRASLATFDLQGNLLNK
jgi:hypothetical protein